MEDGGCSLTFEKVTNPNIIKVVMESPPTHRIRVIISLIKSQKHVSN